MVASSARSCSCFLRDWLAALSPVYWYFWIGLLLVIVVAFFRQGHRAVGRDAGAAPAPAMTDAAANQPVLETRDLRMAFGGLVVFENFNFSLGAASGTRSSVPTAPARRPL